MLGARPAPGLRCLRQRQRAAGEEVLRWFNDISAIEDEIRGCDPETRKAVRQEKSKPLLDDFDAWLEASLAELPPKDELAKAFQRIRASWPSLTVFLEDGRVELDSNRVETLIRSVARTAKTRSLRVTKPVATPG